MTDQSKVVPARRTKRTRNKILEELRTAFDQGVFDTETDEYATKHAVFCFYTQAGGVQQQEEFLFRRDCTVIYRGCFYRDPWDLFSEFDHETGQTWKRRVYHRGRSIDWHLKKRK